MYTVYGYPKARPGRVIWLLEEIGKPYEVVPVSPGGPDYPQVFLDNNPTKKIPLFQEGDFFLFETTAICRYLAATNPEANLLPTDPKKAADVDRWLTFSSAELEQPHWIISKHKFALPEEYRIDQDKIRKWCEFESARNIKSLEWAFNDGREYICGDLSVADFLLALTLNWAKAVDLDIGSLESYLQRMKSRPSYERLLAVQGKY